MSVTFTCKGQPDEALSPNFSNTNARAILMLLGFDSECLYGSCDAATLRQRILVARNGDRSEATRKPYELLPGWGGTAVVETNGVTTIERRGCHVIECGNTDEQTLRRLDALDDLAIYAQETSSAVWWG